MRRGVVWSLAFVFIVFSAICVYASECNDHIDNNHDGYCDAFIRGGYCQDGSILGDKNCIDSTSSEKNCTKTNNGVEICDGLDNNCNGLVDENLLQTQNCGSNVGVCKFGKQTRVCGLGEWSSWSSCVGGIVPSREICGNGKDENCDGVADDQCGLGSPIHRVATPAGSPSNNQNNQNTQNQNSPSQSNQNNAGAQAVNNANSGSQVKSEEVSESPVQKAVSEFVQNVKRILQKMWLGIADSPALLIILMLVVLAIAVLIVIIWYKRRNSI